MGKLSVIEMLCILAKRELLLLLQRYTFGPNAVLKMLMISSIRKKMRSFLDYIQFKYIPCDVLVKDVYPLKIVPNYTMIRALAHQADPTLQVKEK